MLELSGFITDVRSQTARQNCRVHCIILKLQYIAVILHYFEHQYGQIIQINRTKLEVVVRMLSVVS